MLASLLLYLPNLGSTNLSITRVPNNIITAVDAIIKNQLLVTDRLPAKLVPASASPVSAAACVNGNNNASVELTKRFALNPPETPANPAARPASGCLPSV